MPLEKDQKQEFYTTKTKKSVFGAYGLKLNCHNWLEIVQITLFKPTHNDNFTFCVATWVWMAPHRFQFASFITIIKGMVSHDDNMLSVIPACMYFRGNPDYS